MTRDWNDWHANYDDPTSSLSRRLRVVREQLERSLNTMTPHDRDGELRLVSICAGDGRDTLPVLASSHREVGAVLVELDEQLSATAPRTAAELGLDRVEVRTADAGWTDAYADAGPADVLLACGVFGNITDADVEQTIAALPTLLAPGARVIWTRGRRVDAHDPTGSASIASSVPRNRSCLGGACSASSERSGTPKSPRVRTGHRDVRDAPRAAPAWCTSHVP